MPVRKKKNKKTSAKPPRSKEEKYFRDPDIIEDLPFAEEQEEAEEAVKETKKTKTRKKTPETSIAEKAHREADKDIAGDADLSMHSPSEDLDEGELAGLGDDENDLV